MRRLPMLVTVVAGALLVGCSSGDDGSSVDDTAARDTSAAEAAADWLLDELADDGLLHVTSAYEGETSSAPDHGSSVDLALGLAAIGHAQEQAGAIADAVAGDLATYAGGDGEVYAGPSAKALALAVAQARDPHDFGGEDLQARVEGTVSRRGPVAGRISDTSQYGDYANTLGQAYAAGALHGVDSGAAPAATRFLLAQQCEEGFFRLDFSERQAQDQSCDGAEVDPAQAPDVTAVAVLQLLPRAEEDPDVAAALDRAAAWMVDQQAEDGSFADPQNATNANSTGLAGRALRALGEDDAAERAATWLSALQVTDSETGALTDEAGVLPYDDSALEEGRLHGIADPLDRTQWMISTVQAFPALVAGEATE